MVLVKTSVYRGSDAEAKVNRSYPFRGSDGFAFLEPSSAFLRIDQIELGCQSVRLSKLESSGHCYRFKHGSEDWVVFEAPTSGQLLVSTRRGQLVAGPGASLIVAPGQRDLLCMGADGQRYRSIRMMVSRQVVAEALVRKGVATIGIVDAASSSVQNAHFMNSLNVMATDLFESLQAGEAGRQTRPFLERAETGLIDCLAEVLIRTSTLGEDDWHGIESNVRKAEQLMRMNAGERLTVADIARSVNVGVRGLQLAFAQARGVTPRSYLQLVRLERARQRLITIDEEETITSIAWECGFTHLSRFAGLYRAHYDETPSDTVARVRHRYATQQTSRVTIPPPDARPPRRSLQAG